MSTPNIDLNNVVFDSAMLYYGTFDLSNVDTLESQLTGHELGISDGGIKFSSTPEIRQIPIAGHLDRKIKGYERILKVDGKVEGELLVINQKVLEMSLMKKETTSSTKYEKYTPVQGVIENSMYGDLLVIGETAGQPIIVHIMNTYNNSFEVETKDKEEGKIAVNFESSYDPKTKVVPISIYIPKVIE